MRFISCMVRSLTEYACPAWHTTLTEQQLDRLESIQQRALKIIFPDLSYREALAASGLPTLCDRRKSLCRQFFQAMLRPGHRLHHLLLKRRHMSYTAWEITACSLHCAPDMRDLSGHWSPIRPAPLAVIFKNNAIPSLSYMLRTVLIA